MNYVFCVICVCCCLTQEVELDFTRISQPAIASRLELSDAQRAKVAELLTDRIDKLAKSKAAERDAIRQANNAALKQLLSPTQLEKYEAIVAGSNLRFNFRGEKWSDVLTWFATQAELSLVMNESPPGEFTYADQKDYSASQAIDLLNSVLLSKGYTLIRREKMLIVASLKTGIPYELVPTETMEGLAKRGKFEWVRVKFPLAGRPIAAVLEEVKPLISEHGKATPLAANGQLMVTETAGKMEGISVLISAVPVPKSPPPPPKPTPAPPKVFAVYSAKGLDIPATVETLKTFFGVSAIFGDPKVEELQVYATQAQQDLIKSSLERMIANASDELKMYPETYSVADQSLANVEEQLTELFADAKVTIDTENQKLVVIANTRTQQAIKATLAKLGASQQEESEVTVVVYGAPKGQGESLASLLTEMLPRAQVLAQKDRIAVRGKASDQKTAKSLIDQVASDNPQQSGQQIRFYELNVSQSAVTESIQSLVASGSVTWLEDQKKLAVIADEPTQKLVEATVQKINLDLPKKQKRVLRIYSVSPAQKSRFEEVFATLSSEFGDASLVSGAAVNELAVLGDNDQQLAVEELIQSLAKLDKSQNRILTSIEISVDDPEQLVKLLLNKFPGQEFVISPEQDTLLVWTLDAEVEALRKAVASVEALLPKRKVQTLEVYPVKGSVTEIESLISPVATGAKITTDAANKRLVVWGHQADHENIKTILGKIDQADSRDRTLQVYELTNEKLSVAQELIGNLGDEVTVNVATNSNALLIWASADDHAKVKELVDQLTTLKSTGKTRVELFSVDKANASSTLAAVQAVFPDAKLTLDSTSNKIISIAGDEVQTQVGALIEKLQPDKPPVPRVLMSYELKHADATSVVGMLQELHPDVRFAADERANRVLVTAELTEQPRFKAVILQLDAKSSDRDEKTIETYPIGSIQPQLISELVQPLLPDLKLSVDEKERKLIVLGTQFDHQKLTRVLKQLDNQGSGAKQILRTYNLGESPAGEVQNILMQVVPAAIMAVNENDKKLVVWASEQDQKVVESAIKQMANEAPDLSLKTFDLERPVSAELTALLQELSKTARIAASSDGKQLIVLASSNDHQLFAAAIQELIDSEADNLELKVYFGSSEVVTDAESFVTESLPDARIVAQSNKRKLLVWATQQDHVQIGKAVADLTTQIDKPKVDKTIVIYPLGSVDKATARTMLVDEVDGLDLLDDTLATRLIIRATKSDHARVSQVLGELKKTFSVIRDKVLKAHPVRQDIKSQAVTTISSLVPNVEFISNDDDSKILAKASADDHLAISSLIKTLENEIARKEPRTIVAYALKNLDPDLATQVLSGRFSDLSFVENTDSTRLLVWAPKPIHQLVPKILEELEATMAVEKELTVEVYNVDRKKMDAADVLTLLDAKLKENATIQIASDTNSLVVRASEARHESLKKAIEALVNQIQVAPRPITKVYEFPAGNAQTVSDLVEPLLSNETIAVSTDGKKLAVTVVDEGHALIKSVIDQLVIEQKNTNAQTTVYKLNAAVPSVIQQAVLAMSPQANIVADDNSGSLIVSASVKDHMAIANILKQINDSSVGKRTEVFTLRVADPASLVKAITALVADASVTADLPTRSIVVTAKAFDFPQIQTVVDKLDLVAGEKQNRIVAKVYPFDQELVDAVDMQAVIDPEMREGMSVRINEVGNGLIIRTTPEKHEQLKIVFEQVIAQLPEKQKIETRVYRLQKVDPQVIEDVLDSRYSNQDFSVDANTRTVVATLPVADHERINEILASMEKQPVGAKPVSRAFKLRNSTARVVADAIESLLPSANVTFDSASDTVIVTGNESEIKSASDLVSQIDGSDLGKTTQVYRLAEADPRYVAPAVQAMIPTAEVSADRYSKSMFVTASENEHQQIAKMVQELNVRKGQRSEVYRLAQADPRYLMPAIQSLLPNATVSADKVSKTLFVTGNEEDHQQVKILIEKLNGTGSGKTSEVYKLEKASAIALSPALEALIPDGTVTADKLSNTVVVSASAQDHLKVAEVIAKLDKATDDEMVLKIYKSKFDNPDPLNQSIGNMFRDDKQVRINFEWENKRLMVVATEAKHKLIQTLVEQIDQPKPKYDDRFAKVYHLENIESKAAEGVIRNLYGWWTPRLDVRVEQGTNALIVVATSEQHNTLGTAIKEVDGDLRQLEVFPLVNVDPYTVELAVEQLFAEIPENMRPAATSDFGTQQLFVRGTEAQIKLIRDLLNKMGEDFDDQLNARSRGGVRTIPFRGNAMEALREIEDVWPRLRKNKIEIIRPGGTKINRLPRRGEGSKKAPTQVPTPGPLEKNAIDDKSGSEECGDFDLMGEVVKASQQESEGDSDSKKQEPRIQIEPLNPIHKKGADSSEKKQNSDEPQIVIIAGENEITIASSDLEALDQLEHLLRTMQRSQRGGIGSSNFAVFLLANSSAKDTARLLTDLFEAIPDTERQGSVGNAVFVADERLNAMIVYGTRKERDVIREIIEVLDAEDLPDSLTTPLPELVQIQNSSADRVLRILQKVYSNQLSSGGGRKKVDIPEGVSSAVASLLQQINAATAGPILTLGVDEKTNSIVMRAPAELGREVKSFIERIDGAAKNTAARKIRVLQIQGTNADRIRTILNTMSQENQ